MRINSHSHIFNLKSVFTSETLSILLGRLKRGNVPDYLIEPLEELFDKVSQKREKIGRRQILTHMIGSIKSSDEFTSMLKELKRPLPVDTRLVIEGDAALLETEILEDFIDRISDWFFDKEKDARSVSLRDYIEFAYIALAPNIDEVTDTLMQQIDAEDGIIALMMDITDGKGKDGKLFSNHTRDTSRQILRYPGRIFPFFAVNTIRKEHFKRMKRACEKQGFVGIKLYPSLGYKITSKKMDKVLQYCSENDIPLLQHCNKGGFYAKKSYIDYCNPAHWRTVLKKYPNVRICFGHFGGDEHMIKKKIEADSWTGVILEMIEEFPGQVYADVSYHTEEMNGGKAEENYSRNLKKLLADSRYAPYILWGTDFFLVRQRLRESSYWYFFEQMLNSKEFDTISRENSNRFLKLPTDTKMGKSIERYIKFILEQTDGIEGRPAEWLLESVRKSYPDKINTLTAFGNRWTSNNKAHIFIYKYLKSAQFKADDYKNMTFAKAGGMQLRRLVYWRPKSTPKQIRDDLILSLAESIDTVARRNSAVYEKEYSASKAIQTLKWILGNGSNTLADLAKAVDGIYRFSWETEV